MKYKVIVSKNAQGKFVTQLVMVVDDGREFSLSSQAFNYSVDAEYLGVNLKEALGCKYVAEL